MSPTPPAQPAPPEPAPPEPATSEVSEVNPDAQRVIRRLSEQLAAALVEKAMLEDVVQQLVAQQARLGQPGATAAHTSGSG